MVFGAPFDSTTSYRPGTRFASRTMRAESYGLETDSPYQVLDLEDAAVFDGGDLELCFGDTHRALADITAFTERILDSGKLPFMIGGEHLVTLGAVRAVAKKYPDLNIIHLARISERRLLMLRCCTGYGILWGMAEYFSLVSAAGSALSFCGAENT